MSHASNKIAFVDLPTSDFLFSVLGLPTLTETLQTVSLPLACATVCLLVSALCRPRRELPFCVVDAEQNRWNAEGGLRRGGVGAPTAEEQRSKRHMAGPGPAPRTHAPRAAC